MTKLRIRKQLVLALLLLLAAVVSPMRSFGNITQKTPSSEGAIKIEYLQPTYLNISAQGINRLHFDHLRIIKIIGDSSQYSAILPGDGSDLFLVSKVPAPEGIKLTLMTASSESIDLVLRVTDQKEAAITNVDMRGTNPLLIKDHKEIKTMIDKMAQGIRGKYFVEEQKRAISLPSRPDLNVNQYITYRFKDFVGMGFNYESQKERRNKKTKVLESLDPYEVAGNFQNVAAVAVIDDGAEGGKLFVVIRQGEESDV